MDRWKTSDSKSQKKGRKSRETLCFSIFCRSGGSKSRAKAAGAEPCEKTKGTSRPKHILAAELLKKCTPLSHKARLQVKMCKTFLEVEMLKKWKRAALWREAHFEVKTLNTHQVRCSKSALRCGTKHISQSKW